MTREERNNQSLMAAIYVFFIMTVAFYAGQVVMSTFGISIPGLRIAGGLIVAFIGFRMLFPQQSAEDTQLEAKSQDLKNVNPSILPLYRWQCRVLRGQVRLQ